MTTKKFKLGKKESNGLCRVIALRSFGCVAKGEVGGFVEKEANLSHENNAWVYGDARVYGDAWVSGDARVYGNAWVSKQKLIGGYFYHTKQKSEKIEIVETHDDGYETLCKEPKFAEEEKPLGKKVKIRLSDNQVVEGEIIE